MNTMKLMSNIVKWLTILTVLFYIFSCGKEETEKPVEKTDLAEFRKQILFDKWESQNYQTALNYFHSIDKDSIFGEGSVLHGLAHIYQGEVYEVVAKMLAEMQLDLYYKSSDSDHGMKFPIIKNNEISDIKNELSFWLGVDAFAVYGEKEGKELLTSTSSDPLHNLKQDVIKSFSGHKVAHNQQTYLYIKEKTAGKKMPVLEKILKAEKIYKKQEYIKVLSYLDDENLFNKNVFGDHKYIKYYSPSVFKIAALSHYNLGINLLEDGLHSDFATKDSIGYKLIAIMNLGQKYNYLEENKKTSSLWNGYKHFLIQQSALVKNIVESNRMPYCLDWILFEDAVQNKTSFPAELMFLNQNKDIPLKIMTSFITNRTSATQDEIHHILSDFYQHPYRMDSYPTLISGFIEALNLSDFAVSEKYLIQEVSERLIFTNARSYASWHRNRPTFLLSLFGTLRWHGGRLPDCNGFLIDIRESDDRLGSLQEISALFTQSLLNPYTINGKD